MDEEAQTVDDAIACHPLLSQAFALHTEGHLEQAAKLYLEVSAEQPRNFDATHLLGVVALQQGRYEAAQRLIAAALSINPQDAAAMGNLGTSFMRDGQLETALQWFELALSVQPESLTAMINLGTILHNMARHQDATAVLRKAVDLAPGSYLANNLLGACFLKTGDMHRAADLFASATHAGPQNAEGWTNLSIALNSLGRHADARDCADKALALKPESSAALGALGAAQLEQGRLAEAIESYRKGIASAEPSAEMLLAFGYALLAAGRNEEGAEQLQRAMAIDGNNLPARWACAIANLKPIYASETDLIDSRERFGKAINDVAEWCKSAPGLKDAFNAVGVNQPFYIAYQHYNNRSLMMRYGEIIASWMSTFRIRNAPIGESNAMVAPPRALGGKIRLGIAAPNIKEHSVWNAITKGWVHQLDRSKFELCIFQLDSDSDAQTQEAKTIATSFIDTHSGVDDWAAAIAAQQLDVLIYPDVGMESLTVRLASLRLAPIQATSWGHPETSGLPTVDLFLSGEAFEPPNAQDNYSEKLVRLPNFGVYVEPLKPKLADPRLTSLNLPSNEPLLLCPGTPFKYSPVHDSVWVNIAKQLKRSFFSRGGGGKLVFFRSRSDSMDRLLETRLRSAFEKGDVDFDEHVRIIPLLDRPKFFGLLKRSALMLDTLGFSGFNTALQGIECDLPVLAYEGDFMRGRLASAILRRLELHELVATNPQEFIDKAVELAQDPSRRKHLRALIIERRKLLFHDVSSVRALESHLQQAIDSSRHQSPRAGV